MRYEQLQKKYSKYNKIIDAEVKADCILDETYQKSNALISQTNVQEAQLEKANYVT